VWRQFSQILTLLSKHSRKFEGVQKFVLENPSYIFVYGMPALEKAQLKALGKPRYFFYFIPKNPPNKS
jgi:hypothetical protein